MNATLASLRPGQGGIVCGFAGVEDVCLRLMEMGIVEGTAVEVVRFAPAGDPIEVKIVNYALSLRTAEAACVLIRDVA
jgi:ferrous iron transport protein A